MEAESSSIEVAVRLLKQRMLLTCAGDVSAILLSLVAVTQLTLAQFPCLKGMDVSIIAKSVHGAESENENENENGEADNGLEDDQDGPGNKEVEEGEKEDVNGEEGDDGDGNGDDASDSANGGDDDDEDDGDGKSDDNDDEEDNDVDEEDDTAEDNLEGEDDEEALPPPKKRKN